MPPLPLLLLLGLVGLLASPSTVVVDGASATGLSVPSRPQAPAAEIYSDTEQHIQWSPPTSDGGAAVTSYEVSWDTDAGVSEVQSITTSTNIG